MSDFTSLCTSAGAFKTSPELYRKLLALLTADDEHGLSLHRRRNGDTWLHSTPGVNPTPTELPLAFCKEVSLHIYNASSRLTCIFFEPGRPCPGKLGAWVYRITLQGVVEEQDIR